MLELKNGIASFDIRRSLSLPFSVVDSGKVKHMHKHEIPYFHCSFELCNFLIHDLLYASAWQLKELSGITSLRSGV